MPDVCSVLPASLVSRILGHTMAAVRSPGIPGQSICNYTSSTNFPVQVQLINTNASSAYQACKSAAGTGTNLPGVGDQAFGDAAGIYVLAGAYVIIVQGPAVTVLSGDYTKPVAIAKALIAAVG